MLALNVIAHNMARWTTRIGGLDTTGNPDTTAAADDTNAAADYAASDTTAAAHNNNTTTTTTAASDETTTAPRRHHRSRPARKSFIATDTLRRHHLSIPGRLSRSARQLTLHLPRDWRWADAFNNMLANLRAVKLVT